jgi:hypothetical protein
MSIELNEDEVLCDFFVDSADKKFGGNWDYVCPVGQSFINFNRIKRMALSAIYMNNLPFDIYNGNNQITITDGTNSYTAVIPVGYINTANPSASNYFITLIQTALNANPFGWVFTVSYDLATAVIKWTSTVPTRISVANNRVFTTFGIRTTSVLSTSYTSGATIGGTSSILYYICSRALTRFSVRDAHTNSVINNVLGTISINDFQFSGGGVPSTEKQFTQMKIFDFEPSTPIGSEIDIYVVDYLGNPIQDNPLYDSNRITLEFKVVSTRNPTTLKLMSEASCDNETGEIVKPASRTQARQHLQLRTEKKVIVK